MLNRADTELSIASNGSVGEVSTVSHLEAVLMSPPPNVKSILPSLRVEDERIATLAIADIRRQLPSLRILSAHGEMTD